MDFDVDFVCFTCAFLIVKWILMLILFYLCFFDCQVDFDVDFVCLFNASLPRFIFIRWLTLMAMGD